MVQRTNRSGTAAILLMILMVPVLGLLAFSIDYGFLLFSKSDLQRVADQAAVAGAQELLLTDVNTARSRVKEYVQMNLGSDFVVEDSDITIGRFNPAKIYTNLEILDDGVFDTVQVTIRRDDAFSNNSITLYFARFFGDEKAEVSATSTAVLQKARFLTPGADVFPFAISRQAWNKVEHGEEMNIYGDGKIEDDKGKPIPGNWGTLDIGDKSNSTSDLSRQIVEGLSQSDLNALKNQGVIPTADYIDGNATLDLNGDTGLSAGLKHALGDVEGLVKIAPIFKKTSGKGGNLEYEIEGWGAVKILDSEFKGSKNSSVTIEKSYLYDQDLYPNPDLSEIDDVIQGVYTSPVLVQ